MRVGRLRRPITIQVKTETVDSFGEGIETWSTFATTRGAVDPLVGKELLESQQVKADVSHRVRIRHLAGVVPAMRLKLTSDSDRILAIDSVIDIRTRRREMVLMCSERIS